MQRGRARGGGLQHITLERLHRWDCAYEQLLNILSALEECDLVRRRWRWHWIAPIVAVAVLALALALDLAKCCWPRVVAVLALALDVAQLANCPKRVAADLGASTRVVGGLATEASSWKHLAAKLNHR